MIFFETKRLSIRSLKSADFLFFKELFTDAEVLRLIPQKALSEEELHTRFTRSLNLELPHIHERKCDCAIF